LGDDRRLGSSAIDKDDLQAKGLRVARHLRGEQFVALQQPFQRRGWDGGATPELSFLDPPLERAAAERWGCDEPHRVPWLVEQRLDQARQEPEALRERRRRRPCLLQVLDDALEPLSREPRKGLEHRPGLSVEPPLVKAHLAKCREQRRITARLSTVP